MQKKKVYAVSTAHLDTVWRWDLRKTIEEYLPDTLRKNFDLIERYPDYCFNFEGAFRYQLIEEYYPLAFGEIQDLVKRGNWYPAGACYENGDVNIPSPEALFRNILLGNRYFQEKFGVQSKDIFLPDCFGFGQALPSVMKYAGLLGFTTKSSAGAVPTACPLPWVIGKAWTAAVCWRVPTPGLTVPNSAATCAAKCPSLTMWQRTPLKAVSPMPSTCTAPATLAALPQRRACKACAPARQKMGKKTLM